MSRKFFSQYVPSAAKVRELRAPAVLGERVFHPALWHLNRRSVAGGVAAGLFCGLIPGPLQMPGAAIAALAFRVNLPIALATTLYTNPFTIVPLYLLAYRIGAFALGPNGAALTPPPEFAWHEPFVSIQALGQWMLGLGPPLALGLLILACTLALLGYFGVRIWWSAHVRRSWARRRRQRAASSAQGLE